jgi:hypothetical protein
MNIPINVVTDDQFYRFAPGTKTLGTKELDAKVESDKAAQLQAALEFKQRQKESDRDYGLKLDSLAETRRSNDMDNAYKTNVFDWEKSQATPSKQTSGNHGMFTATTREMLDAQARYKEAKATDPKTLNVNYNAYVSEAINLAQKTGQPLSEAQIKELLAQAAALSESDSATGLSW